MNPDIVTAERLCMCTCTCVHSPDTPPFSPPMPPPPHTFPRTHFPMHISLNLSLSLHRCCYSYLLALLLPTTRPHTQQAEQTASLCMATGVVAVLLPFAQQQQWAVLWCVGSHSTEWWWWKWRSKPWTWIERPQSFTVHLSVAVSWVSEWVTVSDGLMCDASLAEPPLLLLLPLWQISSATGTSWCDYFVYTVVLSFSSSQRRRRLLSPSFIQTSSE